MARICCGRKRRTPHCPQCGARLAPVDPIAELVVHCQRQMRRYAKVAESDERRKANFIADKEQARRWEKLAERRRRWSRRWQTRSVALEELMKQAEKAEATEREVKRLQILLRQRPNLRLAGRE